MSLKPCCHHIVRAFVLKTGLRMNFWWNNCFFTKEKIGEKIDVKGLRNNEGKIAKLGFKNNQDSVFKLSFIRLRHNEGRYIIYIRNYASGTNFIN